MTTRKLIKLLGLSLGLSAGLTTSFQVLAAGQLQGKVSTSDSNIVLEGAIVRIQELNLQAATNRDGRFYFPDLPAGSYTLSIDYLGGKVENRVVQIEDGSMSLENFRLTSEQPLEHVLIVGNAASVNKALNRQRSADNIKNIVNSDAIGQYPDANTSEALQRLPGVSVENDQGEGRFVRVRGLGPEFNSVTINGTKVPAPNSSNRAVALDVVPSELLESLEVTKTLTADMDADSLGGNINVKSLSAFDRDDKFYKLTLEGNYDEHTRNSSPKFSAVGSRKFSDGNGEESFGVAGAISWFDRDFGSDNVETGGGWDDNALEEMEQRDYTITRERLGLALNFDYKPSENTDLYLRTLYSEFSDTEVRMANVYEFSDAITPGENTGAEVARELKDRKETAEILSLTLGGTSRFSDWIIDYSAGYSKSSEDTPFNIDGAAFVAEFDDGISYSGTQIIQLNVPAEVLDPSAYEELEVEMAEQYTSDEDTNIKLDVERKVNFGKHPGAIKFGTKISRRSKENDEQLWAFEDEEASLDDFVSGSVDYQFGQMGPAISSSAIFQWVASQDLADALDWEDSAVNDFTIDEDINAAYAMATIDMSALRLVAGLRYEDTSINANGNSVSVVEVDDEDVETLESTDFSNSYSNLFPSVHMRYSLGEKTKIRAAYTESLVRPTFEQLSPGFQRDNDEAEFGNPLLEPLTSQNLDFGIEHYPGFASVYSAYVFHKSIDDFVYQIDLGETAGIEGVEEAITFRNGETANISGLELAASKQFSELPSPWNGLLVGANATWTDSTAKIGFLDEEQLLTRELPLPSQSDFSGNLSVGWENSKFSVRLASNYKSEYLLEISDPEDASEDAYVDTHLSLDLLMRWYATEHIQIFLQGVNLSDEPYYVYFGNKARNHQYEEYGPAYRLGVSLSNF